MSLSTIKSELQSIINELDSIAYGIEKNFSGIGNEKCAKSVYAVSEKLKSAKKSLNNIDTNRIAEEFLQKDTAKA